MSGPTGGRPGLLLVGSGDRRYREYILRALAAHHRIWLLDAVDPTWQSRYVEGTTVTDPRDPGRLVDAGREAARELGADGVLTYDESLVVTSAVLAQELGLPGSPPDAVLACRDKARTRDVLSRGRVPQPRSVAVTGPDEALAAARSIGFPVVVKARGLAGSLGVLRVDGEEQVAAAFAAAAGATWPGVPRYAADVLVEELLTGPEISVDAVVVDGVCTPTALARKQTGLDPYFEETGHVVDAADPLLEDPALLDQLDAIHATLGFTHGATHTEFRLTPAGPRLVEINARLGGDFIPYLGFLASGTDPVLAAADVATGRPPRTAPERPGAAGIRFLYPEEDCEVVEAHVVTERLARPGIHRVEVTCSPGQRLRLPPRGYLARYGYLMAQDSARVPVERALADGDDLIELKTRPLPAD